MTIPTRTAPARIGPTHIGRAELAASLAEELGLPTDGVEALLDEVGIAVVQLLREGHAVELGSAMTLSLDDGIEVGGIEVGESTPSVPARATTPRTGEVVFLSKRPGAFRNQLLDHCRAQGLATFEAAAGADALRRLDHKSPSAVVFEGEAPGWRELLRELKCTPATNRVPIVGLFTEDDIARPVTQLTVQPDIAMFLDPCPFERFLEEAGAALLSNRQGKRTDGDVFEMEAHLSGAQGDRRDLCALIEEMLHRAALPEYFCREARRALSEILDNAVRHGHDRDEQRTVTLRTVLDARQLVLAVRDSGDGFTHGSALSTARAAAARPAGPREPGLVRLLRLVDGVDFNRRGNEVALQKRRPTSGRR